MANVSLLVTRYNNLQDRITAIYGTPSPLTSTIGYGQSLRTGNQGPLVINNRLFDAALVDNVNDRITLNSHNIPNGSLVFYDNNNSPTVPGLVDEAHYYAKVIDANTLELYYDPALTDQILLESPNSTGNHILSTLDGDKVSANAFFNLYLDVVSARIHQIGSNFVIGNDALVQPGDKIFESYISTLESIMTNVEADRDLIGPNQADLEQLRDGLGTSVSSTRTSPWNGTIVHEFVVNFANEPQYYGYWNASGEVRLNPAITGGSGTKTGDWRAMLTGTQGVGEIKIDRTGISVSGIANFVGTTLPRNLGNTYELAVEKNGAAYAVNRFRVYWKKVGTTEMHIRLEFADLDSPGGFGIDENVNGTLDSPVELFRPNGTFQVAGVTYTSVNFPITGLLVSSL